MEAWFGATAIFGIVAACWSKIKLILSRIVSLGIVRVRLESHLSMAIYFYCIRNFKRSPFGERRFDSSDLYVQPLRRFQIVGYEENSYDPAIFWKGWRCLSLAATPGKDSVPWCSILTFIRGTFNLDQLLTDALESLNSFRSEQGSINKRYSISRIGGTFCRRPRLPKGQSSGDAAEAPSDSNSTLARERRLLRWRIEEIGQRSEGDPWEALAFPAEVTTLVAEVEHWLKSETWYRERQIPWRLGWLLHGRPGTGKTSLVRALAQSLDLPVMAFDLATFSNEEFNTAWHSLLAKAPCIVLLEDIDGIFDGRTNRLGEEGGGLTFDCLLNCISGIEVADGVFVVITTNNLEAIDPALGLPDAEHGSTRPGRIDRVIELPATVDQDCRWKIARRILSDCQHLLEETVWAGEGDSGAQFQDRCSRLALDNHWTDFGSKVA